MNNHLKNVISFTVFLMLTIGNIQSAWSVDLCVNKDVTLFFFNGVNTTPAKASAALQEIKRIHGPETEAGEKIGYDYLYNYSNGFEDFVETFEQRLHEQSELLDGRYELFFQALNGDGPWWSQIIDSIGAAAGILESFVDWYRAAAIQNLTALLADPPTSVNYAAHRSRIDNQILAGKKLLMVAHSQGNLFVNAAYDYAVSQTSSESVKVVHIAPASPSLNGSHVLADLDLVINGLRVVGSVPSITNTIPGYLLRAPGINGKRDALGHGLIEIYINQSLGISNAVRNLIDDALDTLEAPPVQSNVGFFDATLIWNGSGDVDLHSYEPSGLHVWYASRQGNSGYLDFDNTTANGPEHYYASCDSEVLETGLYRFSVANYSRADGRTATVQISSSKEGVLDTRSVTLSGATGNTPTATLFYVLVTQDPETDDFSVTLVD